ncbi:histidinol dehydrogenase [uncultured Duncaniella sp.]|uniref:histidinol dehydrogenase n=3 Tax=uncultured Duncaniella sp. TaxID=2768039 RepID=UPI0025D31309|nr:histidinol dehydrogenase [uncultured Duncaniella sp.]
METIITPPRELWDALTARNIPADDPEVTRTVERIVEDVRSRGDEALREYAMRFDGAEPGSIEISEEEMDRGIAAVPPAVAAAIDAAARNIEAFHRAQLPRPVEVETAPGVKCLQRAVPISRVGLYIPGGRAPLFSTVLMLAIPARLAGCREVVMCTPASGTNPISPEILYAARTAGVHHIYKVGGAQAIAAMAFGTATIGRVDKIFGPGNRFVTKAKQLVSAVTAIDMPAGPSEVMIMADGSACPAFVAADMLSQAEHGPDSQAIALCDSMDLAAKIASEVERQTALLSRRGLVEGSLSKSRIIVLGTRGEMTEFANLYAAEHLIISMRDPWEIAGSITAAGSVFIGNYSPESAGDYASGTNHTLPTGGWARSMSGVNIESYMRRITYQELTPAGLAALAPVITAMATAEGLDAHAAAVNIRI